MAVLKYKDLRDKLIYPHVRDWFTETFEGNPNAVAVVILPYPVDGAAQWFVETEEMAKSVSKKLGTRSRVWTLKTFNEYLACFGDKAETVGVAAQLTHREWYDMKENA